MLRDFPKKSEILALNDRIVKIVLACYFWHLVCATVFTELSFGDFGIVL